MVSIIINPVSGGATPGQAASRARLAQSVLDSHGQPGEVLLTERRGHAGELAERAVARGDRLIVAWGGDGTMNEVASCLVSRRAVLGIVPSGSGNGLARELGVPTAPAAALHAALSRAPRRIDAGQLGGRWFFSVAGIGFDAHVARVFDEGGAPARGLRGYVRVTARELPRYACAAYRIDGSEPRTAFLVTLANAAQFGNGVRIAPAARIDDGVLDMVVAEERSRFRTILNIPRLLSGRIAGASGVSIARVTDVVIESDTVMHFHVDGEPCEGGTRLEAHVVPGALLVAARA